MAAAALVAVLSLMEHAPAWVASLRGVATFVAVRLAARWGLTALSVALRADRDRAPREPGEES